MERLDLLSAQLFKLSTNNNWQTADETCKIIASIFGIEVDRFKIWNDPRIIAEASRFMVAFETVNNPAAYEARHSTGKLIEIKLYWMKKTSKTNLSWVAGAADNFEDSTAMQHKKVGIDLVIPESCDRVYIVISNQYKLRVLELHDHLSHTNREILANIIKTCDFTVSTIEEKSKYHSAIWNALNFEPINRRFYVELVNHFNILVSHLEHNFKRKPSVMFTTRLIGRLLFVWFLKKKNLINSDINYFSDFHPDKQKEYYENKLEKLFFEVLNKEKTERNHKDKVTPYLNGGLFDKSETDFCGDEKLTFPDGYFNSLFDTLNKYNFTVDESSPEFQHVAIDPEMLGRIFESLLAEQIDENTGNSKKKATGAFYTPREIVSYMCEQALIEYLKTKVPEAHDRDRRIEELVRMPEAIFRDQDQNKRRDWKSYREAIIKALEGSKTESPLTVLDPAVGSGAFPMGMLHLLVKVYSRLDPKFEKDILGLKRDILSRSLYGVDIEQIAIEITRLRAWLSIIVDIPEGEKVEPLPNLEFKFVCANTLIPLDNTEQATFFTDHDLKYKLITTRDEYFKTSSKTKKEKLQKDYLKLTQGASLFDNKKTQQLKSYKPFDISSSSEFYDPELMHGVQAFDIVMGNPPYVGFGVRNSEKISQSYKNEIIRLYPNSAEYKINLYPLFMERALMLCQKRGIQSFIVPDSFLLGKYFSKIRKYILDTVQISKILLFSEPVFEAVVGYSVVYIFKKTTDKKNNIDVVKVNDPDLTSLKPFSYSQDTFEKTKLNRFRLYFNNKEKILIEKVEKQKKSIGELIEFKSGLISKIGQKEIISPEKKSEEWHKGVVSGGEINRYCISWDGNYIRYKKDLVKSGFGNVSYFENKIFVRQTGDKLISAFDTVGYLCLNNVHVGNIVNKIYSPETITSILNSKLINKYYEIISLEKGRVMAQIDIDVLDSIPVPNITKDQEEIINKLVDEIIILKKQNKDTDTKNIESQIDQLVYKLYDLNEEEINIIEN